MFSMRGFAVAVILVSIAPGTVAPTHAQPGRRLRPVTERTLPAYPDLARRLSLHGIVRIEVAVLPNGSVKAAKVLGGNPVLVQSAVEAVRKWKFEPGPEESTEQVELRFDQK